MPPTEDDEVKILRHKRMLDNIRGKRMQELENGNIPKQSGSGVSSGHAQSGTISYRENKKVNSRPDGRDTGRPQADGGRTQGSATTGGASERVYSGVRPTDRPSVHSDKGAGNDSGRPKEPKPGVAERRIQFQLRNPFRGDEPNATLFTKEEAESELERMTEIYFRGSGLLDDVLEISVKGHEPVQIWQLEADEAQTLAEMHLSRARHDKKAAASARQLLALYDRLYMWLLALPRLKLTASLVKNQGGFSFR